MVCRWVGGWQVGGWVAGVQVAGRPLLDAGPTANERLCTMLATYCSLC